MKPSDLSTSRTRPRSREPGVVTFPRRRICALRIRVSMSPTGSLIAIVAAPLPARLHEARDQPFRAELPERDARHAELAVIRARPAGHLAAIADAGRVAVARDLRQPKACLEALLHGLRLVVGNAEEPLALALVLLDQALAPVVLLN